MLLGLSLLSSGIAPSYGIIGSSKINNIKLDEVVILSTNKNACMVPVPTEPAEAIDNSNIVW
jgi:hypothetical protein